MNEAEAQAQAATSTVALPGIQLLQYDMPPLGNPAVALAVKELPPSTQKRSHTGDMGTHTQCSEMENVYPGTRT